VKIEGVADRCRDILAALAEVIVGKTAVLEQILAGVLANGHILIEDYPGLAKTLIARLVAGAPVQVRKAEQGTRPKVFYLGADASALTPELQSTTERYLWAERPEAELDLVRRETAASVARSRRELGAALARVRRDEDILASADRVAAMSLQAYAEGAVALANVLEAQRNAREALGRYIDDLAAADGAAAAVRLLTTVAEQP